MTTEIDPVISISGNCDGKSNPISDMPWDTSHLLTGDIAESTTVKAAVPMSQYGADAMALGGSTYANILAHYYNGTTLVHYDRAIDKQGKNE